MTTLYRTEKSNFLEKGLRYKLMIIEMLIFILPFLVIAYIFYTNNVLLDFSQMLIFALILLIILASLIILRQIFDRIFTMTNLMKKAVDNNEYLIDIQKDTAELHEISLSFNSLMKKYEETTSELRRRVFELFIIKNLTEIASKSLDMEYLLNIILEKVMTVTEAQNGSILMVEPEKDCLRIVTTIGFESGPEKDSYIKMDEFLARHVISEKKSLLVQDIEADPRTQKQNDPKYGPPSFLSMPIFVRESLISVLNLSNKKTGKIFDSNDEQIVSIMIGEIGFALENAQLHSKIKEQLKCIEEHALDLQEANIRLEEEIHERKNAEKEKENLINDLQDALAQVKVLKGLLPICASCKKIREDDGYWRQIESYIENNSEVVFSHCICPDCAKKLYPDLYP